MSIYLKILEIQKTPGRNSKVLSDKLKNEAARPQCPQSRVACFFSRIHCLRDLAWKTTRIKII